MADLLPPVVATLVADIKQYSADMDKAEGKMAEFGAQADTTGSKVSKGLSKASTAIIGLGLGVAAYSVKSATSFQDLMTQLVTGAGESEKNLKTVSDGILAMAGQVGQTPQALAQGMYLIESAGYHGSAGLKVLKASAEGAAVGGAQMSTVANALTTAMHDYHIPVGNANNVTSALIETVASGKTHLEDLAGSLGKVMPVASALNVPMTNVLGAMASMTNAGLSAQFSAKHLQNTLLALSAPSTAASNALGDVGLNSQQVKDALSGPQGLANALSMIETHVGQKFPQSSVAYTTAMKTILGGTTGYSTALMLTGGNLKTFTDNVSNIGAKMGGAQTQVQGFALVQKDLAFQLKSVSGSLQAGAISLGQWLLPKISDVAKWATGVINFFKGKSIFSRIADTAAIDVFAAAVAVKVGGALKSAFTAAANGIQWVISKITGTAATSGPLDANTGALNRLTEALLKSSVAGGAGAAEGALGGAALGVGGEASLGAALGTAAAPIMAAVIAGAIIGSLINAIFPHTARTGAQTKTALANEAANANVGGGGISAAAQAQINAEIATANARAPRGKHVVTGHVQLPYEGYGSYSALFQHLINMGDSFAEARKLATAAGKKTATVQGATYAPNTHKTTVKVKHKVKVK